MTMRRIIVSVTTAADGSATAYSPRVSGKVHSIHYLKTDFVDGVDFTVTAEATGEQLWVENNVNAGTVRYPRAATHSAAGVAALYATGGTAVQAVPAVANDRVKIVIAQGGNVKTGAFHILVD
jgi:hypothetical protein